MQTQKTTVFSAVLTLLSVLCLVSGVWCSLPWSTREGTIAHAISLPDGTHVYLDAECIVKIKANQLDPYLVIAETFERDYRLVVLTPPSIELRLGQTIDIEGTMTTLHNGLTRAVTNVTVWAYTDEEGELLYNGPLIKGLLEPTPWEWMEDLTVGGGLQSANILTTTGEMSEEPTDTPAPGPDYYPEIADLIEPSNSGVGLQSYYDGISDLQGLPDESLVELQCKKIIAVGTEVIDSATYSYMDISEDPPADDTIRTYYTGNVSTTDRINRICGQIRHVNTVPVICVDSGPDYDPQILEGSCQLAPQGTIAWAKTFPDGTTLPTQLVDKIVSSSYNYNLGYFYIQEHDRSSGIRVYTDPLTTWASYTDRVTISDAEVSTVDSERVVYLSGDDIDYIGEGSVALLGMNNRTVAGGAFNVYTPGATSAFGLNNVGLLVKTWGRVSDVQTDHFYLNDGSDALGVKIDLDRGGECYVSHSLQADDYGAVTGTVQLEEVNGERRRVVRPEGYYDIQLIQAVPHFTNVAASPSVAVADVEVTITFFVDTSLSANPTVTVNGESASYDSTDGYGNYTYKYTIQGTDEPGWATIIISGTDTSGVSNSVNCSTALLIAGIGFDDCGNRISTLDARGVTTYEYDVLGRLTKVTEPDGKWIAYEYDLNSNRTEMTVHLSDDPLVEHVTQYEYNDRNLLWHVTDQLSGVTTYTYKDNGLVDTITYPNGTKTVHTYNNRNWLTQISNRKSDDTIIGQFDYTYDSTCGNVMQVVENMLKPNGSRINAQIDYEYDDFYRLTREHRIADPNVQNADPGVAYDYYYAYDDAGNRTMWQVVGGSTTYYTYDNANKVTSPGTFTYDDAGNTLTHTVGSDTTTYTWDYLNRLTQWEKTGETTQSYIYNSDDIRVCTTPSGGTTTGFLLDGVEIAEEITGNDVTSYVGPGLISEITSSTRTIYHPDSLGSARATSDANEAVTEVAVYDAYGNAQSGFVCSSNFAYAGQHRYYVDSTGLYYVDARYYDPEIGRFISSGDSSPDGSNAYAHAAGNPVTFLTANGANCWPASGITQNDGGAR